MTENENRENLISEALNGIVRVGIVTDRRKEDRLVRVLFPDTGYTSGWLPLLINRDRIGSDVEEWDETQWAEFDAEDEKPPAGIREYERHKHKLVIKPWMPKVGDQVLTIYLPVFNADGFVIGGIQKWQ